MEQEKLSASEIFVLLEGALLKEGGIPIPTTPATATTLTPAEIAQKLRIEVKAFIGNVSHHYLIEQNETGAIRSQTYSPPAQKETKEQLHQRLNGVSSLLNEHEEKARKRLDRNQKALQKILVLCQQLPAIDNSPQGKAVNTLRAIQAIIKSNGEV